MDVTTLRKFYTDNYIKLNEEEKIQLIKETMGKVAQELGLKRQYDMKIDNKDGISYGAFYTHTDSLSTGIVTFAKNTLKNTSAAMIYNFINHELKHAQQDEIRIGLIKEPDNMRRTIMENSGKTMNLKINSIEYKGHQIKEMILPATLYVTNATLPRPIFRDRTTEQDFFYVLNPSEKEAYTQGYNAMLELEKQAILDGVYDYPLAYACKNENRVTIAINGLKMLYPDSWNVEKDVESVYGNICASMTGDASLSRRVTSRELNYACQFYMAQSYAQSCDKKFGNLYAKTHIDPRVAIDNKEYEEKLYNRYKKEISKGLHQASKDFIATAKRMLSGQVSDVNMMRYEKEKNSAMKNRTFSKQYSVLQRIANARTINAVEKEIKNYNFKDKETTALLKEMLPNNWEKTNILQKVAILHSIIKDFENRNGMTSNIKLTLKESEDLYIPSEKHIEWDKGKPSIDVNITAHPVDILYTLGYCMEKVKQEEILQGKIPEEYKGQKVFLEVQKQEPISVMLLKKDTLTPTMKAQTVVADMKVRKPPMQDTMRVMYSSGINEMDLIHKLQPSERLAYQVADSYLDKFNTLQFEYPDETNMETMQKVSDMSESSVEMAKIHFQDIICCSIPVEEQIDNAFLNIYKEACGEPITYLTTGLEEYNTMNLIKHVEWDSYELGQNGIMLAPDEAIISQNSAFENFKENVQTSDVLSPIEIDNERTEDLDDKTLDLDDRIEDLDETWDTDIIQQESEEPEL